MKKFPIGVLIDSFRTDIPEAIKVAAGMGITGMQLYTVSGKYAPENLTDADKKELLKQCSDSGITISALCGDLGRGFTNSELNPELIERSKKILTLAKELGVNIVTTHIGVVPEDTNSETYKVMQDACFKLAEFADGIDAHFAVETGPEPSIRLKNFLDSLNSTGVAVNLDPANLVMVSGDDPVEAVHNLKDYIVHTHAKDGIMLKKVDPKKLYENMKVEEAVQQGRSYLELPLGQGHVNFPTYLAALEEIGYDGYLTIEREVGDDPGADIKLAVDFLNDIMSR